MLRAEAALAVPRATLSSIDAATLAEGALPEVGAAIIDVGAAPRGVDMLRTLRARGFRGPIVVVMTTPDEPALRSACQTLGAVSVSRQVVEASPIELASALSAAASTNRAITEEVAYARRVFAAGQMALSLQHSINNPLAALLAEAQLLQLEELTPEQRGSVDRMVELCRRIVALVRRLDGLATNG